MGYGLAGWQCHMQLVPPVRYIRRSAVLLSIFVDDINVPNKKSKLAAYWDGQLVRAVLTAANSTIYYAKNELFPSRSPRTLGLCGIAGSPLTSSTPPSDEWLEQGSP